MRILFSFFLSAVSFGLFAQVNVLITSPAGYSERFQKEFAASSLQPVAIPLIETVITEDLPEMDRLRCNIRNYDYIAFSSRKAIESFSLKMNDIKKQLSELRFCAIGKDAEYMQLELGVLPAIHPDEPSPMGIAGKLSEDESNKGKTIAVLVPKVEQIEEPDVVPDFLAKLRDIGLIVTRVNAYVTRPVAQSEINKAVELIKSQSIRCIAFTSSAEIEILLQHIENRNIPKEIDIACFGPYTAAYAAKKGLHVSIVAQNFSSFSGFLNAIEAYYRTQ